MIQVTGRAVSGEALDVTLSTLLDEGFDQAVLAGVRSRPGRLVAVLGSAEFYSARPSDEQIDGACTAASRWLRQHCAQLQAQGGMRLGHALWAQVQRVTVDEAEVRSVLNEALIHTD